MFDKINGLGIVEHASVGRCLTVDLLYVTEHTPGGRHIRYRPGEKTSYVEGHCLVRLKRMNIILDATIHLSRTHSLVTFKHHQVVNKNLSKEYYEKE